jgi:hypothetical protein
MTVLLILRNRIVSRRERWFKGDCEVVKRELAESGQIAAQ